MEAWETDTGREGEKTGVHEKGARYMLTGTFNSGNSIGLALNKQRTGGVGTEIHERLGACH